MKKILFGIGSYLLICIVYTLILFVFHPEIIAVNKDTIYPFLTINQIKFFVSILITMSAISIYSDILKDKFYSLSTSLCSFLINIMIMSYFLSSNIGLPYPDTLLNFAKLFMTVFFIFESLLIYIICNFSYELTKTLKHNGKNLLNKISLLKEKP